MGGVIAVSPIGLQTEALRFGFTVGAILSFRLVMKLDDSLFGCVGVWVVPEVSKGWSVSAACAPTPPHPTSKMTTVG